jgi:hypothetical protein
MVLDLLLIGLAIALDPLPLSAFVVVLPSKRGVRKGAAFLFGWLKQRGGQQQVDHDAGWEFTHPPLHSAAVSKHRINHLEWDDAGQFSQVTGREHATGHGDPAGDDRLRQQRSPLGNWRVLADTPFLPGLRRCCLAIYPINPHPL